MEQSKFSKLITALYYLWLFWFGETLASKIFFISFYSNVGLGLAAKQSLKVVTPYLSLSFTLHYLNPQPALHSVYELIQEMRRWIESSFFTTDLKQGRTKQVSHHFHHYHCPNFNFQMMIIWVGRYSRQNSLKLQFNTDAHCNRLVILLGR